MPPRVRKKRVPSGGPRKGRRAPAADPAASAAATGGAFSDGSGAAAGVAAHGVASAAAEPPLPPSSMHVRNPLWQERGESVVSPSMATATEEPSFRLPTRDDGAFVGEYGETVPV